MAGNLNKYETRYLFLTGAAGGLLGIAHSVVALYFQIMDDSMAILPIIMMLVAAFWVLFTSIGFFGLKRALQSPLAYRTFHSGCFTCIILLVSLSTSLVNDSTPTTWPALHFGGLISSTSILDLMSLGSLFVFFVLSAVTLVRFGFDYSFGSIFIWTGLSSLFAAFAQLTIIVHLSTLVHTFLSVYLFHSLSEWVN